MALQEKRSLKVMKFFIIIIKTLQLIMPNINGCANISLNGVKTVSILL